jgi:transposase
MVNFKTKKKLSNFSNLAGRKTCILMKQAGFTNVKIQETLNKSDFFVKKWLKRFKNESNLEDKKRSGRPKKVTKNLEAKVKKYLSKPRYGSLKETRKKLLVENLCISKETVRKIALRVGMKFRMKPSKPILTQAHKEKRLEFVKEFLDPKKVNFEKKMIFYDESYIWTFNRQKGSWIEQGSEVVSKPKLSFTSKLMIAGFVSFKGKSSIFIFKEKETLNSVKYESLLNRKLIPEAKKLFNSTDKFIFVQDNAPCHKTKKIINFFNQTKLII